MDKEKGFNEMYNKIPLDLRKYYVIGLIDGDGCFYINKNRGAYKFSIASSYNQDWNCFIKIFKELQIKSQIKKRLSDNGNSSVIEITGKSRVKILGDYLYCNYKECGIGLPRKYEKYRLIADMCNTKIHHSTLLPYNEEPITIFRDVRKLQETLVF